MKNTKKGNTTVDIKNCMILKGQINNSKNTECGCSVSNVQLEAVFPSSFQPPVIVKDINIMRVLVVFFNSW